MKNIILITFIIVINSFTLYSIDNISLTLSEEMIFSSSENMPHFLDSGKWGLVSDSKSQSISIVDISQNISFKNNLTLDWGVISGFKLNDNPGFFLNSLYADLKYGNFILSFGKKYKILGEVQSELSSGSMIVSNNASPIPKITIGLDDYITIPYTFDILMFKANYSHGWFQGDRYTKDLLLHEKSLYVKLNSHIGLFPYGGLVHEAQWGGSYNGNDLMNLTLTNYMNVILNKSGGEDALEGEQINKLGNHLGIWDMGIYGYYTNIDFQLYYQHFFEDGTGMRFQNDYDGLWGFNLKSKFIKYINNFTFEYLTTKYQSGSLHNIGDKTLGGLDNYYNHYIYKNGWTHLNDVIGNSFFSTAGTDEDLRISNNRMNVFNIGLDGEITSWLDYKMIVAYAEYFPAYSAVSDYTDKEFMWHNFVQLTWHSFIENFEVKAGYAYDFGSSKDSYGLQLLCSLSL